MKSEIEIRDKKIGEDHPILITAEVGVTCNYDLEMSKELIDVVNESGADAAKFIFWFPEEIFSDKTVTYSYQTTDGKVTENLYETAQDFQFSLDEWRELKNYADEQGVILFSTIGSPSGIDYAEELDLEAYKLSSWDFNHHPLWRRIASMGKPMLIDTGPVNTLEVAKVMDIMKEEGNEKSVLVHCFHTDKYGGMNMRAIPYMREAFRTLVGYSSKDQSTETDIMAVTLGATFLEKRLTLDRDLPEHHHAISLEPSEFDEWVDLIRNVRKAMGIKDLRPSEADLEERKRWFNHLVADQDIPKGTTLTREMLAGKRPEKGVSPEYMDFFLGRTVKKDIEYNESISWEDV
ncbi:sialic acid synthase SpsE [Salinibacter ruber]|uniref:N-acetylneuraminate synthase family protein n=1 Tax=Salinibacter ruber TaxID=146919 RepID=UPI00216A5C0B|nr:N-acetylneuraminate synthase family protein [Salinibacter ruber]MCS3634888.1 sialic acid synthase SpsE [Salinibacter ruber]MCS3714637.1 sialic acid synthase SpsE [Salinibacter ruber]